MKRDTRINDFDGLGLLLGVLIASLLVIGGLAFANNTGDAKQAVVLSIETPVAQAATAATVR